MIFRSRCIRNYGLVCLLALVGCADRGGDPFASHNDIGSLQSEINYLQGQMNSLQAKVNQISQKTDNICFQDQMGLTVIRPCGGD